MTLKCKMALEAQDWPISGSFKIARGAKTVARVVVVSLATQDDAIYGLGECVPYTHYGESVESVLEQIENLRSTIQAGVTRHALLKLLPAGAARNAVDCALWDLQAKHTKTSVQSTLQIKHDICASNKLTTAYTISLGDSDAMYNQCLQHKDRALLKIKLGGESGDGDAQRMLAVRDACPNAKLILDANEAWSEQNLESYLAIAKQINADLVEQPLPAYADTMLGEIKRPVMVCADESVHTKDGLKALKNRYDCINIKLDKTGGLTEALDLYLEARKLDFAIMLGCMVGTSLSMAPALLVGQMAEFIDLDGPLLLQKDRDNGLVYDQSFVSLPSTKLWG